MVKQHGDQCKSRRAPRKLHAPEVGTLSEKSALHERKNEHRKKQKLHMLPSGFVDRRKRGGHDALSRQVIKEMKKCSADRCKGKSGKLPKREIPFHGRTSDKYHFCRYLMRRALRLFRRAALCAETGQNDRHDSDTNKSLRMIVSDTKIRRLIILFGCRIAPTKGNPSVRNLVSRRFQSL